MKEIDVLNNNVVTVGVDFGKEESRTVVQIFMLKDDKIELIREIKE